MSKARKINIKLFYIVAALALLVGMLPMTVAPVPASAANNISMVLVSPVAPHATSADSGYNVLGSKVRVTASFDSTTLASWNFVEVVPGTGEVFIPNPPNTTNPVDVTGTFGEALIQATGTDGTLLSADKKWGKIDRTDITQPGSGFVTWNESAKTFFGNTTVTDTVYANFPDQNYPSTHNPANLHEHVAQGAILNWFLVAGWATVPMGAGEANPSPNDYTTGLTGAMAQLPKARFASFDNLSPQVTTKQTVSGADGTSVVQIVTNGEEAIQIVVVPEYPGDPQELTTPEVTSYNFKTTEMEVVPQVRWAGEKIVLEKNFGTAYHPKGIKDPTLYLVRFSTTTPNANLMAFGNTYIPTGGGNWTNTPQSVWTTVQANGLASAILYFPGQGQVDVIADLYAIDQTQNNGNDQPLMIGNEHAFTVYYLKFESLTLGNVVGKRAGHNDGVWTPPNPWDRTMENMTSQDNTEEELNVSADALLRARVRGWFLGTNHTSRPQDFISTGGTIGIELPAGRYVLPDDWLLLAGPTNWKERRIHWDIMNAPDDGKVFGATALGDYTNTTPPPGPKVASAPVIGPFSPGIELMTPTGWAAPNPRPDSVRMMQTVVPNGNLDAWDAPMPPAKVIFEIMSGVGYFKSTWKPDIYYLPPKPYKYTNPFYKELIPAHEAIPAFDNNGGYDWNSFSMTNPLDPPDQPYGPYVFWKTLNQPSGIVQTADPGGHPTKVEVYSDNHGEAMTYLNGNWNLDLAQFNSNGAADVMPGDVPSMPGAVVGNTTAQAWVDYPYFRVETPIFSNTVMKTWDWGGEILGADYKMHMFPPNFGITSDNRMVLATGTVTADGSSPPGLIGPNWPNDMGTSDKRMFFIWATDRDGMQAGVLGARVDWSIATTSGSVPKLFNNLAQVNGVDSYNEVTSDIQLMPGGFLLGTNGVLTGSMDGTQATSFLRAPSMAGDPHLSNHAITPAAWIGLTPYEALFYKFYNPNYDPTYSPQPAPGDNGLRAGNFAVAAIEVMNIGGATAFNVHENITSTDFGLTPGAMGTVMYNTNADFGVHDPIDDAPHRGDALNTGKGVNVGDITYIERVILGLSIANVNCDANGDNVIDMGDVVMVERMILGLQ